MTRAEEIDAIRHLQARWTLFREFIATQTTGPAKAMLLETTDALIAKAQRYITELEQPEGTAPLMLSIPKALQ